MILQRSSIDWAYSTQPSKTSCTARREQRCFWPRGRAMGGTSVINYMIYLRGDPLDYDEWAGFGNPGWSYRDVLPYFIRSEDNRNIEKVLQEFHGVGGYQTVEYFPHQDKNEYLFVEALRESGLEELDQNGERIIGTSLLQHTTRDGERLSVNGAFIRPIRNKRKNLIIRTHSLVNRVLIDPKTKIALGVEFSRNGKIMQALAKKEVIVSGGSINSPKILMLSGLGPTDELEKNNIEVIKDLAVGFNLQDHTTMDGLVFALSNRTATNVSDSRREADVKYYQESRRGPLSSTGPLQINAFVQTRYAEDSRPDIQYSFDSTNLQDFLEDPILTAETLNNALAYYNSLTIRPILLNPRSRGVIRLNYSDPINGDPLIFANTFDDRVDLLKIVEGIKQAILLLETNALRDAGVRLVDEPMAACEDHKFGTDEYWECVVTSYTSTLYHPVGTCKMGPASDREAVVDARLRVHGIKRLRVIDASIMPTVVRGNTNGPVIMIAEMGSDYIKSTWMQDRESHDEL